MKKIKIILNIIVVLILASCCKKEINTIIPLKNKLKRMYISYLFTNNSGGGESVQKFDFYYDTITNKLVKVTQLHTIANDTNFSYWVFKNYDANTIEIAQTYADVSGDSNTSRIYAQLNENNRIAMYTSMPDDFSDGNYVASFNATTTYADTITEPDYFFNFSAGYFLFSNISNFDFVYRDGNCVQSKIAYVFEGSRNDTNITNMTYNTSLQNVGSFIPQQSVFPDFFGDYLNEQYFLGINGYYFTKPNKNLMQTSQSYLFYNYDIFYYYKTDVNNNVTDMCVRSETTTRFCINYKFEYY